MAAAPASLRAAVLAGCAEAAGMPGIVLAASFVGFGSLAHESGFGLALALASTATGWALPGQLVLAELYAVGATFLAVAGAVALTNARLLPMTVTLLPIVRDPARPRWLHYLAAHFIAVTVWTVAMQRVPTLARDLRLPYLLGFGASLWLVSIAATATGFALTATMPRPVALGLVFLNPIYFLLILAGDWSQPPRRKALLIGAVLGPLLHWLDPDWGLLLTGAIGGSAAFLLDRRWPRHD
jgi:predicted branched-subunit amino acid permease